MDFFGELLKEISYNHKDYVQAQADQKRYKISLETVKKICAFYTFTSDCCYRDNNYLHNPVIKEKSPNGRYWGTGIEDIELLYQGISFSQEFEYDLRIYWGRSRGYEKLPSNTLWKMCRFLVFECQYGFDDKADLYNPRLSNEAKEKDLMTIRNIVDPRTVKPKSDEWYRNKSVEWIKEVEKAYSSIYGEDPPWDGVRGYSGRVYWSFEKVDAELKNIMVSIYQNCHAAAEEYGCSGNLVSGANIAGFIKVADAMLAQGLV